jgi:hypothetical protein
MHWSGADCPVVAMKRCNARGAKGAGHSAGKQVNGQPDEPGSTGRRQPSTSGTSRVKREFQARFCERLRVRFPRPTRQGAGHSWRRRKVNGRPEEPVGVGGRRQSSLGGTSRMTRERQVRFCEGLGVKFPGPTRHFNRYDRQAVSN